MPCSPTDMALAEHSADAGANGDGAAGAATLQEEEQVVDPQQQPETLPAPAVVSQGAMRRSLAEFATCAAKSAATPPPLADELESVIIEVAKTGNVAGFPWQSLKKLLARKIELTLADSWRGVPDVPLREGDDFERAVIEPLTRSLLEPRRDGAPFTVQRLCELLSVHRNGYKSTRKYLYALQRAVLATSTEETLVDDCGRILACGAREQSPAAGESRKRKLAPELANGAE